MAKEKTSPSLFYAYRYFLVKSQQMTLFENDATPIIDLIAKCKAEKQIAIDVEQRQDLFLYVNKYNEHTYLFKFCRNFPITKYEYDAKNAEIIESREANYPFVYVVIDTHRQIILLENKTSIYPTIESSKKAFKSFILACIHNLNYSFSMDEITNLSTFWDTIAGADKIFELKLNLKSPNLFGSALSTNELLKKIKTDFNNDEIDMNLKNANGGLSLTKETIGDAIDYAGGGGGHWKLTITHKGRTKKVPVSSSKSVKTIEITDFEDEIKFEGTNHEIIEKIMGLDDIIKE